MNMKLLTVDDISRMLGIGKATVYKLVKKLKHIRIGRKIYVSEEDLTDYIRSHSEFLKDPDDDK